MAVAACGRLARIVCWTREDASRVFLVCGSWPEKDGSVTRVRELRLAEEYDAAQGRGEVRTRADNQHFADGKKLSADEIGLVGEWNPEDDAYATHALPGNPVVLAPPPSMAALPLGGAGVRDLPRPRGHPRGTRLMTDPVQGRHSLECTSPKGRPFRGRCVLCAAEDLR